MSKHKRYPLVCVFWIDSTFHRTSQWMAREEALDWAREPLLVCQTAGFLVHEDKHGLTVALSIAPSGQVADFIRIPRVCIQRVIKLKRGKRRRRQR